jgi:hypothetical protein
MLPLALSWPVTGLVFYPLFAACFLLGIFFDPEDGGDIFLQNIS